jgi:excisionase family DNA binding protein
MVGRKVTTAKAAIILGVSDARVRQLIKEKKLIKVEKEGRDWLLDQAEIKAFVKQPRGKRGAPRRRVFLG